MTKKRKPTNSKTGGARRTDIAPGTPRELQESARRTSINLTMSTQHWLVKTEPEAYAWEDFQRDRRTTWDGVRNFQARNFLRAMKRGDRVLFYASVTTKAVLGSATVAKEHFPDTTAEEGDWSAVELEIADTLPLPVELADIKAEPRLADIPLLKQSRLSVMPLKKTEFDLIVKLGNKRR